MFGILSNDRIEKVIKENFIGRIGCTENGKTYILPISYAYDGENLYAHSREGLKISIMRKNPHVCFQVDTMKDMADWDSVLLWGTFKELTEEKDRNEAMENLMNRQLPLISSETVKLSPEWPFHAGNHSSVPGIFFKINITERTGRFEELEIERDEIKSKKITPHKNDATGKEK